MLITDATHFLSVQLIRTLNQHNFNYLVAADDFPEKHFPQSAPHLKVQQRLPNPERLTWIDDNYHELEFVFQLGNTKTTQQKLFHSLWDRCVQYQLPFIFRSTPLRADWVKQQPTAPFFWAGLSFADAFGPHDHGWVYQAFRQLTQQLPPSAAPSGLRTMVYSKNVAATCYFLVRHRTHSGFYSLDDGSVFTYEQVAAWVEQAVEDASPGSIIPATPPPSALQTIGCNQPFFSAQAGVHEYVQNHLRGEEGYKA